MTESEPDIVAYLYESRIVDGPGAGTGWEHHLRDFHPDEIGNIEYRNLQRLVPESEADVDVEPVGCQLEYEGHNGEGTALTRSSPENVDDEGNTSIRKVKPLVPVPEDVGNGPEPEPVRRRGGAEYYVESDAENPWYFRVKPIDDEAERVREGDEVTEALVYDVWKMDAAGRLEPASYEETPFAAPKYR